MAYIAAATEPLTAWQALKTALGTTLSTQYQATLQHWLTGIEEVTSVSAYQEYRSILRTSYGNPTELHQRLAEHLKPRVALDLWLAGEAIALPRTEALAQFANLSTVGQEKIAGQLADEEFWTVVQHLGTDSAAPLKKRARQLLHRTVETVFSALALDLESDQETIAELAWGWPGAWRVAKSPEQVAATLASLAEHTATDDYLAIGHNVRDFDAPVLAAHEVVLAPENLWDTLLVEMALSPALQTYALRTAHTAAADAELVWQLFVNQVQRLVLAEPAEWELLQGLFLPSISAKLVGLRTTLAGAAWLVAIASELQQQLLGWLRPQPTPSALLIATQAAVAGEELPAARLLLAPAEVWDELSRIPGVRFHGGADVDPEFQELDEKAVMRQLARQPIEAAWVARFFRYCQQTGIVPTAAALAQATRVRLRQHVALAGCLAAQAPPDWHLPQCTCLTAEQLLTEHAQLSGVPGLALIVLEPDLLTLGHKKQLRDKLSINDLLASQGSRTEWLKFSGGQSFVPLTREQATELRAEIPAGYERFWLEKRRYGSFRVWGSFDWEALVARLGNIPTQYVSGHEQTFPKGQLRSVAVDAPRLQQRLGVTPFHPESIYRARYWLLQAELVDSISRRGQQAPLVLLATRPEEVAVLTRYFEKRGYFVPALEAPLARRLELLHDSRRERRLLVAALYQGNALLRANYRGPVEVLLDGFALGENYFLAHGTSLFEWARLASGGQDSSAGTLPTYGEEQANGQAFDEDLADEEEAEMTTDYHQPANYEYLTRDTQFLLQLQRPLVHRWQALAFDNHPENRVWLLDPRLSETPGLANAWQLQVELLDTPWHSEEEYQHAAKQAEELFGGGLSAADFRLDIEEAKQLLELVFLQFWDQEQGKLVQHTWRPEQVPYLNKILPSHPNTSVQKTILGPVRFSLEMLYHASLSSISNR